MLDATQLKGWGGVGVRGAWTQLKEETDAAAADDLYDPGDDSDDAEDDDADDDDGDDDDDDDDDDDEDLMMVMMVMMVMMKLKMKMKMKMMMMMMLVMMMMMMMMMMVFYSHHEHFSHGREMVVDPVVTTYNCGGSDCEVLSSVRSLLWIQTLQKPTTLLVLVIIIRPNFDQWFG